MLLESYSTFGRFIQTNLKDYPAPPEQLKISSMNLPEDFETPSGPGERDAKPIPRIYNRAR